MRAQHLRPFGLEVRDLALNRLDTHSIKAVRELICRHRVVVFRNQQMDATGFADVLMLLGEMMFTDGEIAVDGEPRLNLVTNVGRTRPPRSVFHTDTSYVARPPAFTALQAVHVPQKGGATLFSDQVRVAAKLPAATRAWLALRSIRHAWLQPDGTMAKTWHPALRRHAETGETALFLSTPERCDRISDTDDATGARVIAALYQRSIRASELYRHHWCAGDIVVWDDRLTMHRADHSAVEGERVFYRGMVLGEHPVPAQGSCADKQRNHVPELITTGMMH
ncbi:TauD/TfdA family dioxygenase [Croceicoccus sp. F390]|uniref:TauD/TfdA family dioxygenase n=1 Tax=Croceicoccus esteveae TaxID=3075597 RepID=A0ABU2ZH25_9SPHN|nr:TauD/TfdA family dioxygenase [Croceicoccus sp. F390]MDT0575903.1 TauD/TfdA family dioxygenase [Croceicoccus sp. F390]